MHAEKKHLPFPALIVIGITPGQGLVPGQGSKPPFVFASGTLGPAHRRHSTKRPTAVHRIGPHQRLDLLRREEPFHQIRFRCHALGNHPVTGNVCVVSANPACLSAYRQFVRSAVLWRGDFPQRPRGTVSRPPSPGGLQCADAVITLSVSVKSVPYIVPTFCLTDVPDFFPESPEFSTSGQHSDKFP